MLQGTVNPVNMSQLAENNAMGQNQAQQEDAALFVGNLSPETTDQKLYEYFMPFGKVVWGDPDQLVHHQEEPLHRRIAGNRLH